MNYIGVATFLDKAGHEQQGRVCILHLRQGNKSPHDQLQALQEKIERSDFQFDGSYLTVEYDFTGDIANASFLRVHFSARVRYIKCRFSGLANFTLTNFSSGADFDSAVFTGIAHFNSATFASTASFVETVFKANVEFTFATFTSPTDFKGTVFCEAAIFEWARFQEGVRFHLLHNSEETPLTSKREVVLDFTNVDLDVPTSCQFEDVNMENVRLVGTNVLDVDFTDVKWPEVIADVREASADQFGLIEKLCRQLRHNYENNKHYPGAGPFYYGEMEMRRRQLRPLRRSFFSLTALYYWTSGYGQRPVRALLWIVSLLMLFSIAFLFAGLRVSEPTSYGPQLVRWALCDPRDCGFSLLDWWQDFRYSMLHVVEIASLSRNRHYVYLNGWGDFLGVLTLATLPLQVAMFVLSIRRRFKR